MSHEVDRHYTRRSLLATGSTVALTAITGCGTRENAAGERVRRGRKTSGTFVPDAPNEGDSTIALYLDGWAPEYEGSPRYAMTVFGENTTDTLQEVTLTMEFRDAESAPLERQTKALGERATRDPFRHAFVYPGEPDDVKRYLLTWRAVEIRKV